ncbi:Oxidoreductase [Paraconiothyrium brasiliense]|uniref:Mitochondrial intermembrane space import and assembly protein 40 n=1 Tax=Paraconiothyrium brasiliense TaxID=300254 RepID=A0ABR3RVQ4_9PLEO
MFRPATRLIASNAARVAPRAAAPARRFISTAPPTQKSRSWKSLFARVGAAGAIIYYYNTADVWAEEPRHVVAALPVAEEETEQLPTIDDVSAARLKRKAEREAIEAQLAAQQQAQQQKQAAAEANDTVATAGSVEELEEEAGQQGAFNPETGEINWDCPCLGGMADGPCGEEFKAAFSCFVYSTEEPKGMDCIEKFKDMQGCFRKYPDVYGSELESDADDDEDDLSAEAAPATAVADATRPDAQSTPSPLSTPSSSKHDSSLVPQEYRPSSATDRANKATEPTSESEQLIPKAAHDASDAKVEKK